MTLTKQGKWEKLLPMGNTRAVKEAQFKKKKTKKESPPYLQRHKETQLQKKYPRKREISPQNHPNKKRKRRSRRYEKGRKKRHKKREQIKQDAEKKFLKDSKQQVLRNKNRNKLQITGL